MNRTKTILAIAAVLLVMAGCTKKVDVNLGSADVAFAPEGETVEVALTSNGDWQVDGSPDWVTVTPTSGKGNATLTLTATANEEDEARTGQVKVTSKDDEASLTVTQDIMEAPFLRVTPSEINCDRLGGTFDVEVKSNINWSLGELPEWISASAVSGSGSGSIHLIVALLEGDVSNRDAMLTFSGSGVSASLQVSQNAFSDLDVVVDPSQLSFGYEGGTATVAVTCNGAWTVEAEDAWVTLSVASGEGDAEVIVSVAESTELVERGSHVVFHSSVGTAVSVHVLQEAAPDPHFLEVSPLIILFDKQGGEQELTIGCDTEWKIEVLEDWVTLSETIGNGNATVTIVAEPNTLMESRQFNLIIVSANLSQEVRVSQEAGEDPVVVTLSPDTLFVPYTGSSTSFIVASNTTWSLQGSDMVSYMFPSMGEGNLEVATIIDVNGSEAPRYGYIRAYHDGVLKDEMVVAQEGKPDLLETDLSDVDMRPEGGEFTFHVTSNQNWEVSCDVIWMSYTPTSGFGNGDVNVTVEALESLRPREGHINIKAESGKVVVVTVTQQP